jgi:hypothetical protein
MNTTLITHAATPKLSCRIAPWNTAQSQPKCTRESININIDYLLNTLNLVLDLHVQLLQPIELVVCGVPIPPTGSF